MADTPLYVRVGLDATQYLDSALLIYVFRDAESVTQINTIFRTAGGRYENTRLASIMAVPSITAMMETIEGCKIQTIRLESEFLSKIGRVSEFDAVRNAVIVVRLWSDIPTQWHDDAHQHLHFSEAMGPLAVIGMGGDGTLFHFLGIHTTCRHY